MLTTNCNNYMLRQCEVVLQILTHTMSCFISRLLRGIFQERTRPRYIMNAMACKLNHYIRNLWAIFNKGMSLSVTMFSI